MDSNDERNTNDVAVDMEEKNLDICRIKATPLQDLSLKLSAKI